MQAALAPSTTQTYRRACASYSSFSFDCLNTLAVLPLSIAQVSLFVAHLHHNNMALKTISAYLSALSYVHKIQNLPDPTSAFLISKLVAGACRLKPLKDFRLPITVQILNKLVACLPYVTVSAYDRTLLSAMFLFAFNAFARIGEVTVNKTQSNDSVLLFADVQLLQLNGHPYKAAVTFCFFKHNLTASPHIISFEHGPTDVSAVYALLKFMQLRGNHDGPLFCHSDKTPVSRHKFDELLCRSLNFCRLDASRYKGHRFRIGAATFAAQCNLSDSRIRALGRWSSNAFKSYIRLSG